MKIYLLSVVFFALIVGCRNEEDKNPLDHGLCYERLIDTTRFILPNEYIDYLKKTRFTHGELDSLPDLAIVLHDTRIGDYLTKLAIGNEFVDTLITGTTDPNVIYVIESLGCNFMISSGLPGSGGISTQVAEFGALGVRRLVHIGTCGVFSEQPFDMPIILSTGSYKDEAAYLLSPDAQPIALPAGSFNTRVEAEMKRRGLRFRKGLGYTVPVFYYQPAKLIDKILRWKPEFGESPLYIEMEGAAVFATSALGGMESVSIQAPTDRYYLTDEKKIGHDFVDFDSDSAKLDAIKVCLAIEKTVERK